MYESEVALRYNSTIWYLPSYWLDQCNLKKTSMTICPYSNVICAQTYHVSLCANRSYWNFFVVGVR